MTVRSRRPFLVVVIALWGVALLTMGGAVAVGSPRIQPTPCVTGAPDPLGCPSESPTEAEPPTESVDYPSSITIAYGGTKFRGKVKSDNDDCVAGRSVELRRLKNGKSTLAGTDKTDSEGNWSVKFGKPGKRDRYRARVKQKSVDGGTCLGAQSKKISALGA
jgi:hypothetical protein